MAVNHTSKLTLGPFVVLLKQESASISTFVHRPPCAYDDSETLESKLSPEDAMLLASELMSWAHRNGAKIPLMD